MPGFSPGGIFLSYRRQDAAPYARLLQYRLRERFSDVPVFMDLDTIEPGRDFAEVIEEAVSSSAVLVALIGRQWATLADEQGRRRIDDPNDLVRFELQQALESGVRVIPVLVDGAVPLQQGQLPAELQKLARLNALELSYGRYEYDANRLLELIQRVVSPDSQTAAVPIAPDGLDEAPPRDPARAARVIDDAERIARSVSEEWERAEALATVAKALTATDPDRAAGIIDDAERIARSVSEEWERAEALVAVAKALAAIDPARATGLATDLEYLAQSTTDISLKPRWLSYAAEAIAVSDPDRAESIAKSITSPRETGQGKALARVTEVVVATDPDRAERVAQSITDSRWKAAALATVVKAIAPADPGGAARLAADAERAARAVTDWWYTVDALASAIEAMAHTDPGRAARLADEAEHTAQSTNEDQWKVGALAAIARAMAPIDRDFAARLVSDAERNARWLYRSTDQDRALAKAAEAMAFINPDHAERIARSFTDPWISVKALATIATASPAQA